jgi:hypothetical protein
MTQTINFRKDGNKLKLHFTYNEDIIDVMRAHKGYWYRKDKSWVFPETKRTELYNELTDKGYSVNYLTPMSQATLETPVKKKVEKVDEFDPWADGAFMVGGVCRKCNKWGFIFKNGLCGTCRE